MKTSADLRTLQVLVGAIALAATASAALAYDPDDKYRARRDSITPELGNSVAHNIAVQTIDPWPPNVRNSRIDVDGERLQIGIQRYKANKSLPPKGLSTQAISVGSILGGGAGN